MLIDGITVTVKVAHIRLCHSRMFFIRACPRETQEPQPSSSDRWRAMASIPGILACRRDPAPPPLLLTSPALRLIHEPAADREPP